MTPLTTELLRRTARRYTFENRLASLTLALVMAAFTLLFTAVAIAGESPLTRVGGAIIAASCVYTAYRMARLNWTRADATAGCLASYRAQLTRHRDALQTFPYWGSLPAAPGVALATLGAYLTDPARPFDVLMPAVFWLCLQVAFWKGHSSAIGRLQKEIDLLDAA